MFVLMGSARLMDTGSILVQRAGGHAFAAREGSVQDPGDWRISTTLRHSWRKDPAGSPYVLNAERERLTLDLWLDEFLRKDPSSE